MSFASASVERRSALLRYGVAVLAVLAGAAARAVFLETLGSRLLYITFFPAVAVASVVGGFGPGVFALGLSMIIATWWLPAVGVPAPPPSSVLSMSLFAANGLVIVLVSEGMHRARRRTEAALLARREADLALAESEERLRLGLRAGATGTWDWDIVADRVSWSDQLYTFHGVTRDAFDGTSAGWAKLVHPDDAGRVHGAIRAALDGGEEYELEYRTVRPDGAVRWLFTTGRVSFDPDHHRPLRMMGATIDVTNRKRAEGERDALLESERAARNEAERAGRVKDEFLAVLSHELRTPLNAILGWAQVLKQSGNDDKDRMEGLSVIERNARVQTQLIEDLLDMSRIVSGKLRLDVQRVELSHVIESALESVRPSAEAKHIRLLTVLDPRAGPIKGDPARLQQVLWNLLSNAIKFTPKGGRVQIALQRVNSQVELSVVDSGIGMDAALLPHVFERFRQGDASTTRTHGGLGLGLAIVKHLVEQHGGTVEAESAGRDRGSTFRVLLPVPAATSDDGHRPERVHPHGRSAEAEAPDEFELSGVRVLVLDDEPDARTLIQRVLESRGASVKHVASAREALEALGEQHYDLVISDIGMPEMDGYAFVSRMREQEDGRARSLPAVALTAFARSEDRRRAMLAGFDMFISKPVEPAELTAVVARLARRG